MYEPVQVNYFDTALHRARIMRELKNAGVSRWGLWNLESRYLPQIIQHDERIGSVAYGLDDKGNMVMLVATDRRVIYVDKKPFFVNEDDLTYDVVSGVSFSQAGPGATVTLHTRIKDYRVRTINQTCAERFVHYIEHRCLDQKSEEDYHD